MEQNNIFEIIHCRYFSEKMKIIIARLRGRQMIADGAEVKVTFTAMPVIKVQN